MSVDTSASSGAPAAVSVSVPGVVVNTTGLPVVADEPMNDKICVPLGARAFESITVARYVYSVWLRFYATEYESQERKMYARVLLEILVFSAFEKKPQRIDGYHTVIESLRKAFSEPPFRWLRADTPVITKTDIENCLSQFQYYTNRGEELKRQDLGVVVERRMIGGGSGKTRKAGTFSYWVPANGATSTTTTKGKEQPCGYSETIKRTGDEWWVTCERTNMSGVKKCRTYRVSDLKAEIVPVKCQEETTEVVKGLMVDQNTEETTVGDQKVTTTRTKIQPDVERYTVLTETKQGPGKEFPVELTNEQMKSRGIPLSEVVAKSEQQDTKLGGAGKVVSSKKAAGNPPMNTPGHANHVHVKMPDYATLKKMGVRAAEITDLDIPLLQAPIDPTTNKRMLPQPQEWSELQKGLQPGEFLMRDNTPNSVALEEGFPFSDRHRPAIFLRHSDSWLYYNWLLGVLIRMRSMFPKYCSVVPRVRFDTIALLESYILLTISNAENNKVRLPFKELFAFLPEQLKPRGSYRSGLKTPVRRLGTSDLYAEDSKAPAMNANLAEYYMDQFHSNNGKYVTHLDTLDKPIKEAEKALAEATGELQTQEQISKLFSSIPAQIKSGLPLKRNMSGGNDDEMYVLPLEWPTFKDRDVTRIRDNQLLAALARLELIYGFGVNLWADIADVNTPVNQLFDPKMKRHVSPTLIAYIETFGNPDRGAPFLVPVAGLRSESIDAFQKEI